MRRLGKPFDEVRKRSFNSNVVFYGLSGFLLYFSGFQSSHSSMMAILQGAKTEL